MQENKNQVVGELDREAEQIRLANMADSLMRNEIIQAFLKREREEAFNVFAKDGTTLDEVSIRGLAAYCLALQRFEDTLRLYALERDLVLRRQGYAL